MHDDLASRKAVTTKAGNKLNVQNQGVGGLPLWSSG